MNDIVIPGEGPESTPFFFYVDVMKAWLPCREPVLGRPSARPGSPAWRVGTFDRWYGASQRPARCL